MKRYHCIHAHFYQPARENPWLEAIEAQDSAYPYHDWNERIGVECYSPNAAARILDGESRIVDIVNNYARISFNFGATLLSWMESEAPETYAAILEADRESIRAFGGHGSAIAQGHSHVIFPLANRRDKETQAIWGIRDFERRFGRAPEGMWLPETAVDVETLEVLAEQGIAFTILAPHQAGRIREAGSTDWVDVRGARIDPTRPYLCKLPSGRSIAIFFYDGPISRAVAFERVLTRGEDFAHRLVSGFAASRDWPQLMHIATDGETYGHHRVHGDMALAYALDYLSKDPTVELVNYGRYLEINPPQCEVEIIEDTSWSCTHGIERWRSDCGCSGGSNGGSWSQAWRGPLRGALDLLRDAVAPRFEASASALLREPWAARNDYIALVNDRSEGNLQDFLARHALRPLAAEETVRALKLLEMQRHAMLMYTSCGWFFDEISGIETTQVIAYAARVLQLAGEVFDEDLESPFLERLELAVSNIADRRNGREIYEKQARPVVVDLGRLGAHYAVSSLFEPYAKTARIYCYEAEREDYFEYEPSRAKGAVGRVRLTSLITRESAYLSFGVLYMGDLNISGGVRSYRGEESYSGLVEELAEPFASNDFASVIRLLDKHFGALTFSMKSLFRDEQRKVLRWVWEATIADLEANYRHMYEQHRPLMLYQSDVSVPLPRIFRLTAEVALNLNLRRAAEQDNPSPALVSRLLGEARRGGIPLDEAALSYKFRRMIERKARAWELEPEGAAKHAEMLRAIDLVKALPFEIDLWKVQNTYHRMRQRVPSSVREHPDFRAIGARLDFLEH
jgi:alpha-amylase/alpha-mannosidase (GH57 family)